MNDQILVHGDALSLMAELIPASVAMVLTDPPYNITRPNNLHTMGRKGIEWKWDGSFDQFSWLPLAVEALRPGGALVIFNDWKNLGDIAKVLASLGCEAKRDLVWSKSNPMPRNRDRSYVQAREYALWAVKSSSKVKWTFNRRSKSYETGMFSYPVQHSLHPTKKPDGLFRELIEIHTNPGDTVLDPFAGEATTAVACRKSGRKSISFEIDEAFYRAGLGRLGRLAAVGEGLGCGR